jgi:hypothetical protein
MAVRMRAISFLCLGAMLWLRPVQLHAQEDSGLPSLQPDAASLRFAAMTEGGISSWQLLAKIGLWASGVSDYDPYLDFLAKHIDACLKNRSAAQSDAEFAQNLLEYLHTHILRGGYVGHQTRIDVLLAKGVYNCVSSALIYSIFALAAGFDCAGAITADHAFVTLRLDGKSIDVETTNRYGFDPGHHKEAITQFGKVTGFAYVPPGNYRRREEISTLELASLVLTNRISDLSQQNDWAGALRLAVDRAGLLSQNGSKHVNDTLFADRRVPVRDTALNYGAGLIEASQEEDALQWAARLRTEYPSPRWAELASTALNNLIVRLSRSGRFDDARTALETYKTEVSVKNYQKFADLITYNQTAELHNKFARAFNRRDYIRARQFAEDALRQFPGNAQFRQDKLMAERALD